MHWTFSKLSRQLQTPVPHYGTKNYENIIHWTAYAKHRNQKGGSFGIERKKGDEITIYDRNNNPIVHSVSGGDDEDDGTTAGVYDGNSNDDDDNNDDNENDNEINDNNDNDAENDNNGTIERPGNIMDHQSIAEATAETDTDTDTQDQETTWFLDGQTPGVLEREIPGAPQEESQEELETPEQETNDESDIDDESDPELESHTVTTVTHPDTMIPSIQRIYGLRPRKE
jgi:hypothetical protein